MEKNSEVEVILKTIADLQIENVSFYIDAYQRGYRWTKNQVIELLDDIRDFSHTNYRNTEDGIDRFYCLQPVIVKKNENNEWKIIDGQQRLTTIYLIYICYNNNFSARKKALPYELHYNRKEILEKCLKELENGNYYDNFDDLDSFKDDIDCYYVVEAYKEICGYFKNIDNNPKIQNEINDMKAVLDNYMKIIWYELINCSNEQEIKMFTKINMGKIPLTNAELIKALLLKYESDDIKTDQENIAIKWDDIESKLANNEFWSFLVNHDYVTRIDFIFDVMAHEINNNILKDNSYNNESYYVDKKSNQELFSFHVINNYMNYLNNIGKSKEKIKDVWGRVCEYFRMFNDWYSVNKTSTWYHLIGYIIYNSGEKNIETLYSLSELYKNDTNGHGHKTYFLSELKKEVLRTIFPKGINIEKIKADDLNNLIYDLSYSNDSNKDNNLIRKILLIYNLAVLEKEEPQVKFSFDKIKEKNVFDIEHINAVADNRPIDESDTDENECLLWLKDSLELPNIDNITYDGNKPIKELIQEVIEKKQYLPKNYDKNGVDNFIKVYETIIKYFNDLTEPDSIGNLALLDVGVNRAYKNDVFPTKRKKIIENCCKEKFIPLGTKKVFFKAYCESKNLLKWTQDDFNYYIEDIYKKIKDYLLEKETE